MEQNKLGKQLLAWWFGGNEMAGNEVAHDEVEVVQKNDLSGLQCDAMKSQFRVCEAVRL